MRKVIFNLIIEHHGNWTKVYDAILNKEKPTLNLNFEDLKEIYDNSMFIIDDDYSDKFKKMYMPPFSLFYKGNIELINENVLGIFGNIENIKIEDLKIFRDNNYIICIENNIDYNYIDELINSNFKLVILCNEKLDYSFKETNNNIVYISEYCTNEIEVDKQQILKRLLYSISDYIYLEEKTKENIIITENNYQNEPKNCFIIEKENASEQDLIFSNKKIFNSIKYIDEIINFKKS